MNDEPEIELSDLAKEKAGHYLFGELLKPYSASRQIAANGMGLMYPFVGAEGIEQMKSTGGIYAGVLKDVIIVAWLCSLNDELTVEQKKADHWTPDRAISNPKSAFVVATGWAARLGMVNTQSEKFQEAYKVMSEILIPVEDAKFVPEQLSGGEDEGPKV